MMGRLVPREVFFVSGVGRHEDELMSFELALRDAGIEKSTTIDDYRRVRREIWKRVEGLVKRLLC